MLSIGELARLARVSSRTIRHYHAIGLMPDPPRSEGGYRQYDAHALLRLLRIRQLASLGLSLPQVAEVIEAPEAEADDLLERLDQQLTAQIAVLEEQRRVVAVLRRHGAAPELPEAFAPALAALRGAGAPADQLAQEREVILLLSALGAENWLTTFYLGSLDAGSMPTYLGLMQRFEALRDLPPDDPALEDIAQELIAATGPWIQSMLDAESAMGDLGPVVEKMVGDYWRSQHSPAQQRVLDRMAAEVQARFMPTPPPTTPDPA